MSEAAGEDRIRRLLRPLRSVEEEAVPPFARVVAGRVGRPSPRRRAFAPAAVAVAFVLVAALGWLLARETTPRRSDAPVGLAAFYWQSPTDVLLAPPGQVSAAGRAR